MNNVKYSCKSILFLSRRIYSIHIHNLALDDRRGEGDVIPSRASFLLIVQRMDVYSSATIYLL